MLVPEYELDLITDRKILSGDIDNLIDHFALKRKPRNIPV